MKTTRALFEPRELESGERRLYARPAALQADPRNARAHPPRQVAELRASFRRFGQQKPVVVDATGKVLAGHGFLEALRLEECPDVWIVVSTLDELRSKAFAIADNRTAELGEWDAALLADALAELAALEPGLQSATGFDEKELAEILSDLEAETSSASGEYSNRAGREAAAATTVAPALQGDTTPRKSWDCQDRPPLLGEGPAIAKRGDVWALGPHRVACGDSRDPILVGLLLEGVQEFVTVTDPPYCSGSSQEAGKAAGTFGTIAADNLSAQGFRELIRESLAASGTQQAYLFTDWRQWPNLVQVVEGSGLAARAMIVWDKGRAGIGAFWRPQHELVLFATRRSSRRAPGAVGLGNVLRVPRARNLHHYTEKPVQLLELLLRGDQATGRTTTDVFDPFVGSGSTIVAAARAGRRGFGVEVEPQNVDTALRRIRDELKVSPALWRWAGWKKGDEPRPFDQVAQERLGRADLAPASAKKPAKKAPKTKAAP